MPVVDETPDAMVAVQQTAEVVVDVEEDTRPKPIQRRVACVPNCTTTSSIMAWLMQPI
jgi:hypothetical protein